MHVFDDPHARFELDRADEFGELRWHAIGLIGDVAVVLVAHTIREEAEEPASCARRNPVRFAKFQAHPGLRRNAVRRSTP